MTPFIPDLRNLPSAAVNDKIEETLTKMEEDLPKWAVSGPSKVGCQRPAGEHGN